MARHLEALTLPSYSDAISQDHWKLVAPYVASKDLCNASLACRRWHEIFTPELWGSPASHFGREDDSVYVALTRFRRVLPWARLLVRHLTHTLHLPPAHAELYEGPHAEWLRDMLQRLPRLQCLIVESLPFFDHGCLMALRNPLTVRDGPMTHEYATSLRLLNASNCFNATYSGLSAALRQLPALVWLDLSLTVVAKHSQVLESLQHMDELRILKLRDIGLKDDDISVLAKSIRRKVISLDVSKNHLTDGCARDLLAHCFRKQASTVHTQLQNDGLTKAYSAGYGQQRWSESLESLLYDRLVTNFAERLAIQDEFEPALQHLNISKNALTVEGTASFLLTGQLESFNVGSVRKQLPSGASPTGHGKSKDIERLPGAEKLVNTLKKATPMHLRYLRVSHDFITKEVPLTSQSNQQPSELLGDTPFVRPLHAQELAGNPIIEAGSSSSAVEKDGSPIAELQGNDCFPAELPTYFEAAATISQAKAFGQSPSRANDADVGLETLSQSDGIASAREDSVTLRRPPTRERGYSGLLEERKARLMYNRAHADSFAPILAPKLHTLVLCDVPSRTSNAALIARIVQLISECAKEQDLAREEAQMTYACPPGANRKVFERTHARSVFSLERIILEIADPSPHGREARVTASWRQQPTSKASTEDPDSEAFWDAAQRDFTFFDEEECGQPLEHESMTHTWSTGAIPVGLEKPHVTSAALASQHFSNSSPSEQPSFDVIAEISKFRSSRSSAKAARTAAGFPDEAVSGFWEGAIQVRRPYQDRGVETPCDYYGNSYEKGFRYR